VTAELIPIDRYRATIRVSWMDNSTALDESTTLVSATAADGSSAGGEALYAAYYDLPPGSTGQRSGEVIASIGAARVQLQTCRRTGSDSGGWVNICGAASEPVAVIAATPISATNKGKGKGHN